MLSYIANPNGFVDVVSNKLNTFKYFQRHSLRNFILRNPFRKINQHRIRQGFNVGNILQLFTFTDIYIGKLVSLFHIHSSGNGTSCNNCNSCNENILFLPEGVVSHKTTR